MKAFLFAPLFQTNESIRCTVNGTRVKYPCAPVLSGGAVKHARLIIGTDPTARVTWDDVYFFYNHATGWPASRRVKIIQFADGKTNLFLYLSFVFWYTIFWKKYEKSEGADPISVTSSANALKEGSRRALCFYRITPVNKFLIFFSSSKLLIFGRINIGDIS